MMDYLGVALFTGLMVNYLQRPPPPPPPLPPPTDPDNVHRYREQDMQFGNRFPYRDNFVEQERRPSETRARYSREAALPKASALQTLAAKDEQIRTECKTGPRQYTPECELRRALNF